MAGGPSRGTGSIDPDALSQALNDFQNPGRHHRQRTPGGSPSRKRQRIYGDRYVKGGKKSPHAKIQARSNR